MYNLKELVTRLIAGESVSVNPDKFQNDMTTLESADELLSAALEGDEEKAASLIEQAHQENTSILKYNDENALACVISLAYYSAKKDYSIYRELAGGKGFADMVFVPRSKVNKPAIIVELKWNKSVSAAVDQIKNRQYIESLKGYSGEVILVGINYDAGKDHNEMFKKHECRIERISI